ncbi:MAG: glycoside hydrolase family 15 protein [Caldisphaera sp.]|nr:MAG: glycoside hydrolase family 15 protein [Caldisphaera sp.]
MRTGFISNGNIAALYDNNFYIKSIYYPLFGQQYNQSLNGQFKIGIWNNGLFNWIENWDKTITMDGLINIMESRNNDINLEIKDIASMTHPVIIRKVSIKGNGLFRVIFYNDFRLNGNEIGDTAFYDPQSDSIIHYKQNTWFLISSSNQIYEYTTGRRDQGVVIRDCEDGTLNKNPIAQGSVDSAFSIADKDFYIYFIAGDSYNDIIIKLNEIRNNAETHFERDSRYWKNITQTYENKLAKQSLAVIIGHIGENGAIPASFDTSILKFNFDTYAYVWPRDASLTAMALDMSGYWSFTNKYYRFLFENLFNDEGFLYQKYNSDGSFGSTWHPWTLNNDQSLNIQEDETSTSLYTYYYHFILTKDYDSLRDYYETIIKAANFLADFRDEKLKLPLMTYDLWEENLGVNIYTVSSVIAGLNASSKIAKMLGDWKNEEKWSKASNEILKSLKENMFDKSIGAYVKSIKIDHGKIVEKDLRIESSLLGLSNFDILDPNDQTLVSSVEKIREKLWVKTIGGIARYENDYYQRADGDYKDIPGNPWIITTLWLSQYYMKLGNKEESEKLMKWAERVAIPSGFLPEQVNPFNGSPLSVTPLLWSHAEYLKTHIMLNKK